MRAPKASATCPFIPSGLSGLSSFLYTPAARGRRQSRSYSSSTRLNSHRKYSCSSFVLLMHWSAEFMKQVLWEI